MTELTQGRKPLALRNITQAQVSKTTTVGNPLKIDFGDVTLDCSSS